MSHLRQRTKQLRKISTLTLTCLRARSATTSAESSGSLSRLRRALCRRTSLSGSKVDIIFINDKS